jgi:hypothetical protein
MEVNSPLEELILFPVCAHTPFTIICQPEPLEHQYDERFRKSQTLMCGDLSGTMC